MKNFISLDINWVKIFQPEADEPLAQKKRESMNGWVYGCMNC